MPSDTNFLDSFNRALIIAISIKFLVVGLALIGFYSYVFLLFLQLVIHSQLILTIITTIIIIINLIITVFASAFWYQCIMGYR